MRVAFAMGCLLLTAAVLWVPAATANPTCDFEYNCMFTLDEENGGVCLDRDADGWCRGGYVATGVRFPVNDQCPTDELDED